jgi:hypothetical protein
MAMRCANHSCSAVRRSDEGKLYRLDLELGSLCGGDELHTEYLWLCSDCASYLRPRVQQRGDSVQVLLSAHCSAPPRIPPQIDRTPATRLHVN